jgi:hypothetical protein
MTSSSGSRAFIWRKDRLPHAGDPDGAQILELEVPLHQLCGVLGQADLAGLGELLHARGEAHRVPLRRVVHAEIVPDLPHDDLARVEAHAHGEAEPPLQRELAGVASQLLAEMQRRIARPLGVILVGDGRAEESHDAVSGVLVDRALEAVDAVGQDLEEAVQDPVPLFGVDLLGELHRPLHVGKEDGHLLALALQRGLRAPIGVASA